MKTLKEAREEKGIKLTAVADHLGISRQTYRLKERNPGDMTVDECKAACDFIGVPVSEIFFGSEVN